MTVQNEMQWAFHFLYISDIIKIKKTKVALLRITTKDFLINLNHGTNKTENFFIRINIIYFLFFDIFL